MKKTMFVLFAAVTLFSLFPTDAAAETAYVSDGDTTYNTSMSTSEDVHISSTYIEISLSSCSGFQLDAWTYSCRYDAPYWESDCPEIVSVNFSTGWVTPHRVGTTYVTATINSRSCYCEVVVLP